MKRLNPQLCLASPIGPNSWKLRLAGVTNSLLEKNSPSWTREFQQPIGLHIDEWVENDQKGNKEVERNTLVADLESEVGSIAVMRDAVRLNLASTKWLLRKVTTSEI